MTTSDNHLLVDIHDGVAILTLNRPETLNVPTPAMLQQGIATLEQCATDSAGGCIVVTGADRGFCTGGDVAMMAGAATEQTFEQRIDRQRRVHRFPWLLYSIPKVTIAAVNRAAAGAGFGIALACDLRIASDKAKFTTAFAKVGFGGDFGITWPLTHIVGESKAKELLFFSDVLTAEQALQVGLVNRVIPHDQHMKVVRELATHIACGPLISYRYMKENVRLASTGDYAALLEREAIAQLRCGETQDHKEGVAAFMEKREPRFLGR